MEAKENEKEAKIREGKQEGSEDSWRKARWKRRKAKIREGKRRFVKENEKEASK